MKYTITIFTAVLITAMILSSCGGGGSKNEYDQDTLKVYEKEVNLFDEVTIGKQVWTSKNLDVATYRNGDVIPEVQDKNAWANLTTGAWCYYDNDASNGTKYGKLYNWYAVNDPRGLSPNGYHIPTDAEWTILTDYLGGESEAGTKIESTSGFSGLPGGARGYHGAFYGIGNSGRWWSSTEDSLNGAWYRTLSCSDGDVSRGDYGSLKEDGFSVRCMKD